MEKKIIDIFLFVDPLGKRCNSARKIIRKFRTERSEKINLRIVPMVNYRKVYGHSQKMQAGGPTSFVEKNNKYLSNTYRACLAFHASTMQGKNKGYEFLSMLQEQVVEENVDYSDALAQEVAATIGLDIEMFMEDYNSELTKKFYKKNLRLASDMNVASTPSCVIYRNDDSLDAVRLNDDIENELLHAICGLDEMTVPKKDILNDITETKLNNLFRLGFS